jgi:hypothetical protein
MKFVDGKAELVQCSGNGCDKEIGVLEVRENAQVDSTADAEQPAPSSFVVRIFDPATDKVIGADRDPEQAQKLPVPAAIEEAAGSQEEAVSRPMWQQSLDDPDDDEEREKIKRRE